MPKLWLKLGLGWGPGTWIREEKPDTDTLVSPCVYYTRCRVPVHSSFSFPSLHISDLFSSSSSSSSTLSPSCYWLSPHSFIRILPFTLLDAASGQRACSGALEGSTQVPCQLSPYFTFSRLTLAYLLIPGCLKCASRMFPSHPPTPSYCHEDMSGAIWSWRLYYLGARVCFWIMILQASSFLN